MEEKPVEILDDEKIMIIIPECCREGWSTCSHVAKPEKSKKTNPGL